MWRVTVTKHARLRWRQRYGTNDTDEAIVESLRCRVYAGLTYAYNLRGMRRQTIEDKFIDPTGKMYRDNPRRLIVGDLTVVVDREGDHVTVITVY